MKENKDKSRNIGKGLDGSLQDESWVLGRRVGICFQFIFQFGCFSAPQMTYSFVVVKDLPSLHWPNLD